MLKLMLYLAALCFALTALGQTEIPLPGPGAPPSEPAPPQPEPPTQAPEPTPIPMPTPTPTPAPKPKPKPKPIPKPTPKPTPPSARPPLDPGPDTTYTLGSGQVGRFKKRTFTFQPPPNLRNLRALRVTCTNKKIKIKQVAVKFRNGQIYRLPTLEGLYVKGDTRISYMHSTPVLSVSVVAATSSVFKTDGSFRLDAAASENLIYDEEP